jgi:hypothetical protein
MAIKGDRFQRWQENLMDQLGYAINLVLTLAVAALAYEFALLRDRAFTPSTDAKWLTKVSLAALAVAGLAGVVCVLTRLWNVRGTAQRARESPKAPSERKLDVLGTLSWYLFYVELISFAAGILTIGVVLLVMYGGKLG